MMEAIWRFEVMCLPFSWIGSRKMGSNLIEGREPLSPVLLLGLFSQTRTDNGSVFEEPKRRGWLRF